VSSKPPIPNLSLRATEEGFAFEENLSFLTTAASIVMVLPAYVIADEVRQRDTRDPGETARTYRLQRTSKHLSDSSLHLKVFAPIYHMYVSNKKPLILIIEN
jgi:hypothetical protein